MMGMLTDKQVELLSVCFDNDPKKIEAFLNFLASTNLESVKMPDVKMIVEEDTANTCCMHEKDSTCLLDFPDSVRKCEKPCTFYKGVIR